MSTTAKSASRGHLIGVERVVPARNLHPARRTQRRPDQARGWRVRRLVMKSISSSNARFSPARSSPHLRAPGESRLVHLGRVTHAEQVLQPELSSVLRDQPFVLQLHPLVKLGFGQAAFTVLALRVIPPQLTSEAALWLSRAADAPGSFDLAQQGGVDDPVPERGDERHVLPAEPAARLDVDGHPALVAAVAAIDPG